MAVDLIGAKKILFGSDDWIENCPYTQEVMLNAIRQLGLSEEAERKILGENAVKILGHEKVEDVLAKDAY
jgi:predicted TIM-barrel fold metal-dependent hydrolase